MKRFNRIGVRFWFSMITLIMVGMFLLGWLYLWSEEKQLEESLQNEGITAANTLGSAIGLSMLKGDYEQISPLMYSLLTEPHVQYVIIRDTEGRIINQKGETFEQTDLLVEKVPLQYFQKQVGEVEIALRTDELKRQKKRLYIYTAAVILITSILAAFLSYILSRRLTAPLKKLVDATRQMTWGGRNVAVLEEGTKEIQELSSAFNQMSKTIANHEEILKAEIDRATQKLSEKIEILEAMSDISHSVIEKDFSRQEVIAILLRRIKELIQADHLCLFLRNDPSTGVLHLYSLNEWGEMVESMVQEAETPFPVVLQERKPYIRHALQLHKRYPYENRLLEKGIQSLLILPLVARNHVIGTINLVSRESHPPMEKWVEKLTVFTHPIAIMLDRAAAYESLHKMAFYDYLTGLPNRRLFRDLLNQALQDAKLQRDPLLAVMFLDLDRFKTINDTLGHDYGDLLLKKVGQHLSESVQEKDIVCRMSGDEFTLLINQVSCEQEVIDLAEKILEKFNHPWILGDYEVPVTASIGIAFYPIDGEDAESLINHADTAMYRVKSQGKNNYHLYTPAKTDPTFEQLIFENDLRKALEQEEFLVYYQPKVNIKQGIITGLEALIRWKHPVRGFVSPGDFIPLAEETGLIVPIGEFVFRTACKQNVMWQQKGFPPLNISVNLSSRQFLQSNLVGRVTHILNETGIQPGFMELEITESMTMDVDRAISILSKLRNLGLQISMDDFGTGYSCLNYLQKLPVNRLKIDQTFVKEINVNDNATAVVSTIISLAHSLGMDVVAEGVETEVQIQFLQQKGCDEVQGYFFSQPLSPEELEEKFTDLQKLASQWRENRDTPVFSR